MRNPLRGLLSLGSGRYLRAILREQQAQTLALREIAVALRQATRGDSAGLLTGVADGKDDMGLVQTSNQEILELLEVEERLRRMLGRIPDAEEVVAAWEKEQRG